LNIHEDGSTGPYATQLAGLKSIIVFL